ncbi:hypothetical protein J5A68_09135 [Prevotella melaninogenica]|uniref:hypothetical protein n=1 Tax=Prevotella melaninogenica TaxID=28132 RepID=UPI001BA6B48F|nr:hypothetical protein [Prevotella melaninogenica]QUB69597.1 hypothetical protein J5A68_09135 [Prevotella melaninogenica]
MANNFSIGGIKIFSTAGTIFASLVGAPLLIFIITRFTLGGNKDAIPYADTYIKNSDTIVVKIPINHHEIDTYDDIFTTSGWFMGVAQTRSATYNMYYFYSPEHKKYLGVVTFKGCYNTIQRGSGEKIWYDDIEDHRLTFLYRIKSFSAYVNRQQWLDPTYGTKDNPVPIFFKRALSGHETLDMDEHITIKPSVNKKFVELYLAHELSSKEFNRLYGEDMKRLGLTD